MIPPTEFVVVVQGPDASGDVRCRGVVDAPVVIPARIQVVSDDLAVDDARLLTNDIWAAVSPLGTVTDACTGPSGLECWVTESPVSHNVLVAVFGPRPFDPALDAVVRQWLSQGFTVVAVLSEDRDPQVALPSSLRSSVALRYRDSVTETTQEIVDLLLLGGEERRAFISYAHRDGSDLAVRLFDVLARRRFDVYLDRFRTAPSTDFVERIDDELRDKAMVVVVETPEAVVSTWVLHEIMTARHRGHGLVALNIGGTLEHPLIGAGRRLALPDFDEDVVSAAIERHYRAALLDQRRRRSSALQAALRWAAEGHPGVAVEPFGDRCDLVGGVSYSVLGAYRPAGVRQARRIAEVAVRSRRRPVVYCPRPARSAARDDLGWLDVETPVAVVPDGRLLRAATEMVGGRL